MSMKKKKRGKNKTVEVHEEVSLLKFWLWGKRDWYGPPLGG